MTDMPTPSQQKAAETSLGDLVGEVSRDLSNLMRQELELAKAELSESAKRAGMGAGLLGGAGYAAVMAVFFLSVALWWGLGDLIDSLGWSAVIVAVIWAIIAGILYAVGRSRLKTVQGAPQTVETVKEIPEALKRNEENR
ncbi:phage holin family protein [Microbacterium trichothecenolyticum]|uniref:phage holin family protein n=1 Tax=Microbacterium trichothecenolyticum TaxID=69370 RepID=UPI0035BE3730